jgi:hypothetical protein
MEALPERRYRQLCDDMTGELTDELRGGKMAVEVGDTRVRVFADYRTGPPEVGLQFSAPAVVDGHNRDPLGFDVLTMLVEVVVNVAGRELPEMPPYTAFRPTRVDLPRDIVGVESPSRTLAQIARLPVPRANPDEIYGGRSGGVQTLTRGNTSRWLIRGYDKHAQMIDLAGRQPSRRRLLLDAANGYEGLLRVEVQLNAQYLREKGINAVDDITGDQMTHIAAELFQRGRFGDVVGGSNRLRDVMTDLVDQGRPADARAVAAVLTCDLLGCEPPLSRNPLRKARTLLREYRLTVADLTDRESDARRLDFWSGKELIGMDAIEAIEPQV